MNQYTKLLAARGWIDASSGSETWRLVGLTPMGFMYAGPGFKAKVKAWDELCFEAWKDYAAMAAGCSARLGYERGKE